jgi:hypothetical protein
MAADYYFDTDYTYTVFGADEHLRVTLWREGKKRMKAVDSWTFSTGIFDWQATIAHSRADRRIAKLVANYGAQPL